ncbi:MAG: N-acetylmuramoyl-L-alanine amidase [Geobacter sp.]|nr:N-acetylmuramoyl-L-alanine amidase [Geobacter sp.]
MLARRIFLQRIVFWLASCLMPSIALAAKARKESKEKQAIKPVPANPHVTELRYWSNPSYSRISVTVDREVHFEHHEIKPTVNAASPSRIYVDLKGAKLSPGVKDVQIGDGLLKTARIAQYQADVVRLVLDIQSIKEFKVFTFSDPFRVIIDVRGERQAELKKPEEPALEKAPPKEELKKPATKEVKEKGTFKPGKIRRIVIDPGHGGHDPGAVGQNGAREKDVVLQMGHKLAKKLREDLGLDVVMTRSTDVFIELQERTAIANKVNADLFVSIHANASLNRNASGIETYYLNLAKTEKVAQLAARENGTSLEKVSLLQAVLFDLMANYKLNDSAHLAEDVQKSAFRKVSSGYSGVKNLGVKQGPFYVLVGATMPSILVETAFISNEKEEVRLTDDSYQDVTVAGILDGIKAYITSVK